MAIKHENIRKLLLEVKEKLGIPVSNKVVRATIESLGIRNIDVEEDFGLPTMGSLSEVIYYELITNEEHKNARNKKELEVNRKVKKTIQLSDYLRVKASIFAYYYPLGILHLLPVFLQIAAIVIFGYSLWTFIGFNHVQSTAVVLGVIIGLITTAGFVQVIGRQASFYWNHDDFFMTKKTISYLLKVGVSSLFVLLILMFFSNSVLHLYPFSVLLIVISYAFLIGCLLLTLAPLHTIKQRWVITVAIFSGTVTAIFLKTRTNISIYYSHWIGISTAILISGVFLLLFFNKYLQYNKNKTATILKSSVLIYHNYNYFLYGLFLYFFIFIDRILAWTSTINGQLPYVIYFEKNYELGMDLAILVFLLLSGVLEYGVASFSKFLDVGQKNNSFSNLKQFNSSLLNMYWQQVGMLVGTAILLFVLLYFILFSPYGYQSHFSEALDSVSINVSLLGGFGYIFLAWGMLNSLYLFTLGQPTKSVKAILFACLVNAFIGLFFSRFIAYEYSVVGMVSGSVCFMIVTLKAVVDYLKNLDYYYYAAY
jgi:hypothetical protein